MRALLWKEFHENFKWAAVPILLMGAYTANVGICLCDRFFMFVSLLGAVFGGALGILQMTFESHGDRRALLLHRPISGTNIFLAKLISGTALYLLGMGLPLVIYLATEFVPGHVAQLLPLSRRWPLVFPWFADMLAGLVYYLAGALAALRPGRWYGSRLLGFPAAMLATFLAWNLPEFAEVLFALLVLAGALGLAAWGSFLTAGDSDSQPLTAKIGLAVTFLLGLCVLSLQGKASLEYRIFRKADDYGRDHYQVNRDGTILLVEHPGNATLRVRDLTGQEMEELRRMDRRESQLALGKLRAAFVLAYAEASHSGGRSYRTISCYLVRMSNRPMPAGEGWCFDPGVGLLVGYDFEHDKPIGSIGPEGFSPDGQSPGPVFSGRLDYSPIRTNPDYLVFPGAVYAVDFAERRVRPLFVAGENERVHGARDWVDDPQAAPLNRDDKSIQGVETYQRDSYEKPDRIVVGTNQAIYILDSDGNREVDLPVVFDSSRYMMILNRLDDPPRYAVHYHPSFFLGLAASEALESQVVEYSADGRELSRTELPALPRRILRHQPWLGLLTSPAEAAVLLLSVSDAFFGSRHDAQTPGTSLQYSVLEEFHRILPLPMELAEGLTNVRVRLYVLGLAVHGVLGAGVCVWLSRRLATAGSRRALWIGCGLVFGLVGAALMACFYEWPARVACPKCRYLRLVTRDTCERCGVPHAIPDTDGTEIFTVPAA